MHNDSQFSLFLLFTPAAVPQCKESRGHLRQPDTDWVPWRKRQDNEQDKCMGISARTFSAKDRWEQWKFCIEVLQQWRFYKPPQKHANFWDCFMTQDSEMITKRKWKRNFFSFFNELLIIHLKMYDKESWGNWKSTHLVTC